MNEEFYNQLRSRLEKQITSRATLFAEAEELRKQGKIEDYWDLTAPRNMGDLFYLSGDTLSAQKEWQQSVEYFQAYDKWCLANNIPLIQEKRRAGFYLRLRQPENALPIYHYWIAKQSTPEERGMFGIALIQCGAVEEGQHLLRERIQAMDDGSQNPLTRRHHLAECWFWVGDYSKAAELSHTAAENWPSPASKPPVAGLFHLIRFAQTGAPDERREAVAWLEKAVYMFFAEEDIPHAVDAYDYLQLINTWRPGDPLRPGLKILGISFSRA